MDTFDYCVIGGGIVGLATAMKLLERRPGARLLLIEKETDLGRHQTGHNSGVIHAGVYYPPGSLKADLCRRGAQATKDFCAHHNVPVEVPGKLIVATTSLELERMDALFRRANENGVAVERQSREQLKAEEPSIDGLGAILVPATGIVDYRQVCRAMARVVRRGGGQVSLGVPVQAIREEPDQVRIDGSNQSWAARQLVACAGLQADRVALLAGLDIDFRIVPFRGEYYRLPASKNDLVRRLIYPVPDPALPFLGVHLTRMIDGSITVGPNAVQAWKREGYGSLNLSPRDTWDLIRFPGFWRVLGAHLPVGLTEMKDSWWKRGYLRRVQRYCPSLTLADLRPHPAGVRAQAVSRDGQLIHDFLFVETKRMLHVGNAPSPAATAAIPIGELIAAKVAG